MPLNKLTPEQVKSIPTLLKTMSRIDVAKHLGIHEMTVHYWIARLTKLGYPIPPAVKGRPSTIGAYVQPIE